MKVGLIGLGNMGSGVAANLLKAGHALTVYNRTSAKAEALIAKGATLAKTPGKAARSERIAVSGTPYAPSATASRP